MSKAHRLKIMFKYCPKCGKKFNKKGPNSYSCKSCHFIYYQNSVPTASAIIAKGNKILLTKRAITPQKGWWDTPGGFLANGEDPEHGLKREIKEELGLKIKPQKILGIYIDQYIRPPYYQLYTVNIYYLIKITGGHLKPGSDVSEAKWFSKHQIPKKLAFKVPRQAINDWKKLIK